MRSLALVLLLSVFTSPAAAFFCFGFGTGGGSHSGRHAYPPYPPYPPPIPPLPRHPPADQSQRTPVSPAESPTPVPDRYQGWRFRPMK